MEYRFISQAITAARVAGSAIGSRRPQSFGPVFDYMVAESGRDDVAKPPAETFNRGFKAPTILPGPNHPRSPPLDWLGQVNTASRGLGSPLFQPL
jgi:hypothetical protein